MTVTYRNRPLIVAAIMRHLETQNMTCAELLSALHKDFPFLTSGSLHQILRGLDKNQIIDTIGSGNSKIIQKHVDRKPPERPPPQNWFTPLFTSISPL